MASYVLSFHDIDRTSLALAGGKGAALGELSRLEGIRVPDGFVVTTEAYQKMIGEAGIGGLLDQLALVKVDDRDQLRELSGEIRTAIEATAIPPDIKEEIAGHLSGLGADRAYAVRSSATAEDLPGASFAGQQDTYLNVTGLDAVLAAIRKCWASLFTERAVAYRMQNGFDHRAVRLAVVVQQMVLPQAAGVLFTADPLSGNRKVTSIDAGSGLGEALVSGLVNPDLYKVRDGEVIEKSAEKNRATDVLSDEQILQLAQLGRQIEAHFGFPQDIEWCLADGAFYILQSRPITTLFPVPEGSDGENRVYLSVGHQQMMTDPMKPLGLTLWQVMAFRPMFAAGGRLFVDITQQLASPAARAMLLAGMGQHDPLMQDAVATVIDQGYVKSMPDAGQGQRAGPGSAAPRGPQPSAEVDPAVVSELIERSQAAIEALKRDIQAKAGPDLLDFIVEDIGQLKKSLLDPQSSAAIRASMDAASWLNENMKQWLGEERVADTLAQSAPGNVTSEMGLALLDVADVIRPYPEVVDTLQHVREDGFPDALAGLAGGREARDAIHAFLDRYGMRCVGEIDITRPRWREKPAALVPLILGNIRNFAPGEGKRRFEQGRQEALQKEQGLLARLAELPDGAQQADQTGRMIAQLRSFAGYREYPKYAIASRFFAYKQALLEEAGRLVQAGVIHEQEDIYWLTFDELRGVVRTRRADYGMIRERQDEFRRYERLPPPRVITSDGEIIAGRYKRGDLPPGSIPGLAVSSGIVEGRARVILRMEDADLAEGDILVTRFTDPSWTPLFVAIKGLVTEVGGLMTHGAVIAREYGLPAVVGVENATALIPDGARIRVNGTDGYVEILP